jgi:MFS family permease
MSKAGILAIIVIAQFLCTSVWFAGNAVVQDLSRDYHLSERAVGVLLSAVQLGFITGTLTFAILTIADRFSPVKVFFFSSLLAAGANVSIIFIGGEVTVLLVLRFLTGFFLAGIYPVGMKIASDHFGTGLGKALGFLVGALVMGTALPHLIKSLSVQVPWDIVFKSTTSLAVLGGLLMLTLVPDGPFRKVSQGFDFKAIIKVFGKRDFRATALGYFGHMWELYAFWAFIPLMISWYWPSHQTRELDVSLLSFYVIGSGGLACVVSGQLSRRYGPKKIATVALICSGICCLISPLSFYFSPEGYVAYLLFWGLVVIADSPMFSSLVALNAPEASKGTALTIVNCIGFSITVVSIALLGLLADQISPQYIFLALSPGPILGLVAMRQPHKKPEY